MPQDSDKLSPELTIYLVDLPQEDNPVLPVLFRVKDELTTARRSKIEALGCEIRSVAGDIVTANIPSRSLLQLAALDFIAYIQRSRPLYPEPKGSE
jgi:hypothetical protein